MIVTSVLQYVKILIFYVKSARCSTHSSEQSIQIVKSVWRQRWPVSVNFYFRRGHETRRNSSHWYSNWYSVLLQRGMKRLIFFKSGSVLYIKKNSYSFSHCSGRSAFRRTFFGFFSTLIDWRSRTTSANNVKQKRLFPSWHVATPAPHNILLGSQLIYFVS